MNNFDFKAIPTFRILDYQKAMAFYVDYLGFTTDWEHRFGSTEPVYMQVSKNGLVLHLSENKRFKPGVIIFVETKNIIEFHKELKNKEAPNLPPELVQTPWQTLQLEIEDPFGNLLRFNETIIG